ncbi:uncharacterized protein EAF01_003158 [Botrytis porri]|uniref:uncharacterized protein n=1 Tax=Botrytis porri TaxID=87229 RepID=UPI0019010C07|nr:uncharacterized protein EAF01_003158 [Botrytis porri]KAF7909440.1 hypothetical protein EAF01_003158 [Botrytis porri]
MFVYVLSYPYESIFRNLNILRSTSFLTPLYNKQQVSTSRPTSKPTSTDFENTCIITCFEPVDIYLKGIQEEELLLIPEALALVVIIAQELYILPYYRVHFVGLIFSCHDEHAVQNHNWHVISWVGLIGSMNIGWLLWRLITECGKDVESTPLSSAIVMNTSTTSISAGRNITINSAPVLVLAAAFLLSAESASPIATSVTTKSGALKIGHSLGLVFLGISYWMFFL